MNLSPLQLESAEYPLVSIKANPSISKDRAELALPLKVKADVLYDSDGRHFAFLSIEQSDPEFAYSVELDVFAPFSIDVEGCKQAYKRAFNPEVVAVNVARILFSGAREMISIVSARSPYGVARIPTLLLGPSDVEVAFEEGNLNKILVESFGFDEEQLAKATQLAGKESLDSSEGGISKRSPEAQAKKSKSKQKG